MRGAELRMLSTDIDQGLEMGEATEAIDDAQAVCLSQALDLRSDTGIAAFPGERRQRR